MEARFTSQPVGDSCTLEYDIQPSSSFDHEVVRKERIVRLKNQARGRICESAKDPLGSSLLERHISKLSDHQSTACESVVEQLRDSAAWSSFIEKLTADAAPDDIGETSNSLSNSAGAYEQLRSRKLIEEHLHKNFIELIQTFTFLPDIKYALSKSNFTRCMISSGAIPMGTPHAADGAWVDKEKIRPDMCIVSFTEIKVGAERQKIIRYQCPCPGVLPAEYLNRRSNNAKQPELSSNGVEAELHATCARTVPTAFWENVLDICSVKKDCDEAGKAKHLGECALWASEIFRYQWNRQFVNVCFLCGTMLQFLRFDRSGCSASQEIDIREHTATFLKLMFSFFVLNYSRVGLNALIGRSLHGHRVVRVGAKKFELGKQIVYPAKDSLICRGTAAFMAREISGDESESEYVNVHAWDLCYKISWVHSKRPQEGAFLVKLKGVRNVVECLSYDSRAATLQGRDYCIFGDYTIKSRGKQSLGKKLLSHVSQPVPHLLQGPEHSPTGSKRNIPSSPNLGQPSVKTENPSGSGVSLANFSNRDCRQLVMTYVHWEFDDLFDPLTGNEGDYIDQYGLPPSFEPDSAILRCWARFFETIRDLIQSPCRIMHRDISFANIRIKRADGELIPVFTDWDMSAEEGNQAHFINIKAGTPGFMAAKLLQAGPGPEPEVPHGWYHDVESAFWLCYLASIRFDKDKRVRLEFKKLHSHPDHQELARYKIIRLLRFEAGNEKRCVLPSDRPIISKSLMLMGALISPLVTKTQPAGDERAIATMVVERIIRGLWEIAS